MYVIFFFFFNDTATTEIYTLSLHDALPISTVPSTDGSSPGRGAAVARAYIAMPASLANSTACALDRKSTRLNSSHLVISYAVFCLKKKNSYSMLDSADYILSITCAPVYTSL